MHIVGITHSRAFRTTFFVNGHLIGGEGTLIARLAPLQDPANFRPSFGTPLHVMIPPALLRAGENMIHVRVHAASTDVLMHGLPRVTFGETTLLRIDYMVSTELGFGAQRGFFAMALVSGIITLFLWLARRSDKVMFWYSAACLLWGLVSIPRLGLRWADDFQSLIPILSWFLNYGLVVPVVVLCLRIVDIRWPRFEMALWAFLALESTFPLWGKGSIGYWFLVWDVLNTALLLTGIGVIVARMRRPWRWSISLQIAALLLMAALMFFEVMRYLGWVYIDFKAIRHYHVPLMLLAIGSVIFERHVLAVRRTELANAELEQRVAEKAREIEASHERVEAARREQALVRERQRILTDMYDGLGASLIGLLRQARSDAVTRGIELRVQEALQELRVAVDALQSHENDLVTVLANLRLRIEGMIQATGVRLIWEMSELPPVKGLSPSSIFALQRILLETIANTLKHSGARHIRFGAHAQGDAGIRIEVEDDGAGFDPPQSTNGLGLANMRFRASSIGARIEIRSRPGAGTLVAFVLPPS